MSRRQRLALVVVLAAVSAAAAWLTTPSPAPRRPTPAPTGTLVLALAGDIAPSLPIDPEAAGLREVGTLVRSTSLGIANFDLSMPDPAPPGALTGPPRWPAATPDAGTRLRTLGFAAVSLANNHALDFGADGLAAVERHLADAGIAVAGAGRNLEAARQPAFIDTPGGVVALVGATLSFPPGTRATPRQGDILGRPGVHGLRYTRRLTVDAAAFAGLSAAFPRAVLKPNADGRTWDLHGITVARGPSSGMALVPEDDDIAGLIDAVRAARATAAAVVVSLHAHEPGNRVDAVPELLRDIARAAIDAGADAVHGHGPHRLRAIERYQGRPIFYSLGNLVFPDRALTPQAADAFEDHAMNVLSPIDAEGPPVVDYADDVWWQSVIAIVRFEPGRLSRVELHPVDIGLGQDIRTRGLPAPAGPATATAILERLSELSAPFGTAIAIENGVGVLRP
jgi:poly-gamma-glutamate synthesis protein (capsule biosynthesis protein)